MGLYPHLFDYLNICTVQNPGKQAFISNILEISNIFLDRYIGKASPSIVEYSGRYYGLSRELPPRACTAYETSIQNLIYKCSMFPVTEGSVEDLSTQEPGVAA